ncbi:unnamed protein product [Mytilus coruscus]|uniref:WSC domain-containing protein n=1 Tax=Mytilus coruscus TaxID=42192 RepID=A0A6J8E3H3_MYTCO|nr:unnamed protein product [Mytilus coruscus]
MIFVVGFTLLLLKFCINNANTLIYTSKYVGCIEDNQYRVFPYNRWSSDDVSNDACVDHCAAFTVYSYAGTEEGMDCYCGVKGDKMTEANENDCNMPCHGNDTQICGGDFRLSVYQIFFETITSSPHPLTSLADTTTDLMRSTRMDLSSIKPSHTDHEIPGYSSLRSSVSPSAEWTSVDSVSSKTTTDAWTQVSTDTESKFECVCPCKYVSVVNKTKEELIARATKDLDIDKTQTSSYKNSKKSAEDHRLSSRNIGIVGVLVISITVALLVLVDCINGPFQHIWVCVKKHKRKTIHH